MMNDTHTEYTEFAAQSCQINLPLEVAKELLAVLVKNGASRHVIASSITALWRSIVNPCPPRDVPREECNASQLQRVAHCVDSGEQPALQGISFGKLAESILFAKTVLCEALGSHFDDLHEAIKEAKFRLGLEHSIANKLQKLDNAYKELRHYSDVKADCLVASLATACSYQASTSSTSNQGRTIIVLANVIPTSGVQAAIEFAQHKSGVQDALEFAQNNCEQSIVDFSLPIPPPPPLPMNSCIEDTTSGIQDPLKHAQNIGEQSMRKVANARHVVPSSSTPPSHQNMSDPLLLDDPWACDPFLKSDPWANAAFPIEGSYNTSHNAWTNWKSCMKKPSSWADVPVDCDGCNSEEDGTDSVDKDAGENMVEKSCYDFGSTHGDAVMCETTSSGEVVASHTNLKFDDDEFGDSTESGKQDGESTMHDDLEKNSAKNEET